MRRYTTGDVAGLLGISKEQVRRWARAGLVAPERGRRGEYQFPFEDLVLLRAARGLAEARVPARRVRRALLRLKQQLPHGRPLTTVRITASGDTVLVQDGRSLRNPESGQLHFEFEVAELAARVAPLQGGGGAGRASADDWFNRGCDRERTDPSAARAAYERALALDPTHAAALVNLGLLDYAAGRLEAAAARFRAALAAQPDHALAAYDLGITLEDLGRPDEAAAAYERALRADPTCADARNNLTLLRRRRAGRRG
jgi:tetratricopeptide (TPR) repeat protein